ncbi:MAG: group 1 glycosyl transferase [Xanthobacteraceae bacterium]|nr:MAG: group 1 glycosyl transferase [Xanthobacteraceae bacterium]
MTGRGGGTADGQREVVDVARPLVLCLVNEAWFFRSHFLPWARRARTEGFDVALLASADGQPAALASEGIGFVPSLAARGGLLPRGLWRAARQVRDIVADRRPVILHAFGLHGMAIAALARLRGVRLPLVVSVTGLGFLAANGGLARLAGGLVAHMLRIVLDGAATRWLTENPHDGPRMGLRQAAAAGRVTVLTGAGVDAGAFAVRPLPARPPLTLILVARMVRSKGVDLAVAALSIAREAGIDATLTLVGDGDPANPGSYDANELAAFAATPGVRVLGRRTDIPDLLADHHLFLLPSRGGEGLPRALLEAAAAGRPAIVTAVPGCGDFVADGETGFVVEPESAAALADAIGRAAKADLAAMGDAARAKVERSGTVAIVGGQVVATYRALLDADATQAVVT